MKGFKHIYIDIYKENIYFATCSWQQYKKLTKSEFGLILTHKNPDGLFGVRYHKNSDVPVGTIWIKPNADLATLAHECFHATFWIMQMKGIGLSDESEESYSWLLQFFMERIIKFRKGK